MTPFRKRLFYVFTGVLIISLAACAPLPNSIPTATEVPLFPTATPGIPITGTDLANTQWTLVSFTHAGADTPVLPGSSLTLSFQQNGEVEGTGGCNSFGGQYSIQGSTLLFQQLLHTDMACTAQGVDQQEQSYLEALQSAIRFEQAGDSLKIWYGNRQDVLNFSRGTVSTPVQPVPTSPVAVPSPANPTATTSSSGSADAPERIMFAAGATTATVSGHLEASQLHAYLLRGMAGQTMTIHLTFSSGQAILIVWGADGNVLMSDHAGATSFQGVLPTTQDYNIHVRNRPDGPTDYTMTVSIPAPTSGEKRIEFAPGATTATVTGHLNASASDQYLLRAAAGQTLTINLAFSSGQAILVVWGADGNVLMSDHAEASSFQMVLPTTQDYHIQVKGRPEGPTDYTMTISIPALGSGGGVKRIEFAPGATTATVTGQLNAFASDQYLVRAGAGQTMTINLTFTQGEAILVIWGQDGNVLMSDHAGASSFQMVLPTTQDYHIMVKGSPDGSTTYTMTVTIPPAP